MRESRIKKQLKNPFFLIGLLLVVIAIPITIYSIYTHWNNTKELTTISDFDQSIPSYVRNEIEKQIYQNVVKNFPNYPGNFSLTSGHVRPNSFFGGQNDDTKYGNLIVDLNDIEQNYQVFFEYSDSDPSNFTVKVFCVDPTKSYFPASACVAVGDNTDYDAYKELDKLLPYSGNTKDGNNFYVKKSLRYLNTNLPYVEISVNSCNNEAILQEGLEIFKDYIRSQNLNPDTFTFESRHECYFQF